MRLTQRFLIVFLGVFISHSGFSCSFCAITPKGGLSGGGPAKDPGTNTISTTSGQGSVAVIRKASNDKSDDGAWLKTYVGDGQGSKDFNSSRGILDDNR